LVLGPGRDGDRRDGAPHRPIGQEDSCVLDDRLWFQRAGLRDVVLRQFQFRDELRERGVGAHRSGVRDCFLFVPTSQLAYSCSPKNKNNKASSLTNLFRNQGGRVGIAFVTTVLGRRAQYHLSVLVTRITNFHATFSKGAAGIANRFVDYGYSAADAAARAVAQIQAVVRRDAIVSRL